MLRTTARLLQSTKEKYHSKYTVSFKLNSARISTNRYRFRSHPPAHNKSTKKELTSSDFPL